MSDWKTKRFWTDVNTTDEADGFGIRLDQRPVRTPAKAPFVVPTQALATEIAKEWSAQQDIIDPGSMPFTRMANSAIDKVRVQKAEVADMLAAYGDADLLCYRAEAPAGLVARQSQAWDPLLEWASAALDVRLETRIGVVHIPQKETVLDKSTALVHELGDFQMAAFHDLVSLSGSLVIGFAAARRFDSPENLWAVSRVDEDWQQAQWGEDEEALETANRKKTAFFHATLFYEWANRYS